MALTRETNSEELEIIAAQVSVILTQMREEPTVAFKRLCERIEIENTQIEMGIWKMRPVSQRAVGEDENGD